MSSWICVISNQSPKNWDLCKDINLFGIAAYNRKLQIVPKQNDQMLFWYARHGFLGWGEITADTRSPLGPEETPWAGGSSRFSKVIPFKLTYEASSPVFVPFVSGKQVETGISSFTLQRGIASITNQAFDKAQELILSGYKIHPKSPLDGQKT